MLSVDTATFALAQPLVVHEIVVVPNWPGRRNTVEGVAVISPLGEPIATSLKSKP